jgi:hypothetical protein
MQRDVIFTSAIKKAQRMTKISNNRLAIVKDSILTSHTTKVKHAELVNNNYQTESAEEENSLIKRLSELITRIRGQRASLKEDIKENKSYI